MGLSTKWFSPFVSRSSYRHRHAYKSKLEAYIIMHMALSSYEWAKNQMLTIKSVHL